MLNLFLNHYRQFQELQGFRQVITSLGQQSQIRQCDSLPCAISKLAAEPKRHIVMLCRYFKQSQTMIDQSQTVEDGGL